jgi:hypothetical protein
MPAAAIIALLIAVTFIGPSLAIAITAFLSK